MVILRIFQKDGHITTHLSQHAEYTALGVNPNLNYGLGVTMVHPCRLISWNKHPMAVRVLLVGQLCIVGVGGVQGTSTSLSVLLWT